MADVRLNGHDAISKLSPSLVEALAISAGDGNPGTVLQE